MQPFSIYCQAHRHTTLCHFHIYIETLLIVCMYMWLYGGTRTMYVNVFIENQVKN